jgi:hypothetical protein
VFQFHWVALDLCFSMTGFQGGRPHGEAGNAPSRLLDRISPGQPDMDLKKNLFFEFGPGGGGFNG